MIWIGVVLIVIGFIILIVSFEKESGLIGYFAGVFVCTGLSLLMTEGLTYEQGQIDAIKGDLKYEMKITYEQVDSLFVPVDTVFVEIKHK